MSKSPVTRDAERPRPLNDSRIPSDATAARSDFFDFSKPNNRRAFTLLSLSAIAGLAIAGYGLFTANGTSTNRLPPEDIALVNRKPIYRSDFVVQTEAQYGTSFDSTTPQQRQKILEDMIDEELTVQRGLEVDLPGYDPGVRAALVSGVELQMYADVLAKEPAEEELKKYYQDHRSSYASVGSLRLRDLVLNVRADESADDHAERARTIVAELRHGTPLDDAFVKNHALRDSGRLMQSGKVDLDDIFDFAAEAHLTPKVYAATQKLQAGEVSDPIDDSDGVHIVLVTARKAPRALDFDAVRPRVWSDIKTDAQKQIRDATYKYLRSKANILTAIPAAR